MDLDKVINNILSENITIIASSPLGGRVSLTTELIYDYVIKKNKKTFFITLEDSTYNIAHLISKISNLNLDDICSYLKPASIYFKNDNKIERDKYLDAIDNIRKSNLYIYELEYDSLSNDYINSLIKKIEEEKYQLVIINRLDIIIEKTRCSLKKLFSKLKEVSRKNKTKFVFITGVNQRHYELELKDLKYYSKLRKYLTNVIVLKKIKRHELEAINYWNSYEVGKFKIKEVN